MSFTYEEQKMEDRLDEVAELNDSEWNDDDILNQVKKWVSPVPETILHDYARSTQLNVASVQIRRRRHADLGNGAISRFTSCGPGLSE